MGSKGIISFLLGLALFIGCCFWKTEEPRGTILKISIGFISAGIIEFIVYLYDNRKRWKLLKAQIFKRNQKVRVTIAYLYRIEINGKYVLIKRHKKDRAGYQPVGGAFKYFKEESRETFEKLGIEPCTKVERDADTENDLRVIVNKRKNLVPFLKWFESRKNREIDPWREFYEELIDPDHLPIESFKHIKYEFLCKHEEGILKSPVYDVDEYRYAEIYELKIESDAQKKAILDLIGNAEFLFATPDEIRKGATDKGDVILPHTFKILPK